MVACASALATADAAFKVSELEKWPYFFNVSKTLVRDLLQDIYRDKGEWQIRLSWVAD